MTRHFLNLADAGGEAIAAMITDAIDRKAARAEWPKGKTDADRPLADHVLAMIFEKNSTRTRASFELAGKVLGADVVNVSPQNASVQKGESLVDTVRTLSAMHAAHAAGAGLVAFTEASLTGYCSRWCY